ncbi:sporulation protein YqfD [Clostridium sp. AM33-3]|uniref:sporulation protein YqfD n=1 Tax=Clostridium sp. AM33-3 TaxID=2292304 RepID=UPI000E4AB4C4|nr:sporulation protein YqfD [Clostridium sp. AM33-3]RHT23121.1 sporulation protein [Clostridium sp. AM33-3]
MRWLKQHYTGYVRVRLTGRSPERFFNLCRSSKILLWNIACEKEEYRFFLLLPDFYRIRPFARKAGVRVRIQEKLGLPFFLYRNRKRKLFAVGAASFFLLLFVLSRFIWNISFSGNLLFTDDMLTGQLREIGVCYGMPKRGVDCDRIEEELRSRCSRIVWVSAHVSGTRLQIRIRENETADGIPLREESPRNLVAETAGTVVSILVRAGKAVVQPGDEVEKGQILVEGMLPVTNDSGEVERTLFVRADADIRLRTTKIYREWVPHFQTVRSYTGKMQRGFRLRAGAVDILAMPPLAGKRNWDLTGVSRQIVLFGDFFLPVWTEAITAREYEKVERKRTKTELNDLTKAVHERKLQKLTEKGVQIIENDVKILDNSNGWIICGSMTVEEEAGTGQKLE